MTKTEHILKDTRNRYYPLPEKNWKYYQEWHNTVFFHWKVPAHLLREYIPKGIELDLIDNFAWVSMVAFEVKNMRPRNLPALPYVSDFLELNIRTYVVKDEIPGIYMFSIETNKFIEVLLTRLFIGLPYKKADLKQSANSLWCQNELLTHYLEASYNTSATLIQKTATDIWLTERHALYDSKPNKKQNKVYRFDIHHKEWELKKLDAKIKALNYNAGKFNLSLYPDKMQFARKIEVLLWGKEAV